MNYFADHEQWCKHCRQGGLQPESLRRGNLLREIRNRPTALSSAYRCPVHNQNVSRTGPEGPHTTGQAMDVRCSGAAAREVLFAAVLVSAIDAGLLTVQQAQQWLPLMLATGFTGIGVAQRGDHGARFIHLDDLADSQTSGPRPWVWTY
jgi:zinc D-Ala-D-Ala carboxypeptidase